MSPTINFKGASFEILPKDDYPAVFESYEMAEGEKGYYANCIFTISDASEYAGRKQWKIMSFAPGALPYTKRDLIALGANPNSLDETVEVIDILDDLIGNDCILAVTIRMYEGEEQNVVQRIKAPDYAALAR